MCGSDDSWTELQDGVCSECRSRGAIPRRGEPSRPRIPCARCNHTTLVRARLREHSSSGGDHSHAVPAPLAVTFGFEQKDGWFLGRRAELKLDEPIGLIEAYVCQRCGFTELYTSRPGDIPIGEAYATELFEVGGEGPFR